MENPGDTAFAPSARLCSVLVAQLEVGVVIVDLILTDKQLDPQPPKWG